MSVHTEVSSRSQLITAQFALPEAILHMRTLRTLGIDVELSSTQASRNRTRPGRRPVLSLSDVRAMTA